MVYRDGIENLMDNMGCELGLERVAGPLCPRCEAQRIPADAVSASASASESASESESASASESGSASATDPDSPVHLQRPA
jgi:hypothetical protein